MYFAWWLVTVGPGVKLELDSPTSVEELAGWALFWKIFDMGNGKKRLSFKCLELVYPLPGYSRPWDRTRTWLSNSCQGTSWLSTLLKNIWHGNGKIRLVCHRVSNWHFWHTWQKFPRDWPGQGYKNLSCVWGVDRKIHPDGHREAICPLSWKKKKTIRASKFHCCEDVNLPMLRDN